MPTIPLFNGGERAKMQGPPQPTLYPKQGFTVDLREAAQNYVAPTMDPRAAKSAWSGLQNLGQGVANLGGALNAIAERQAESIAVRQVNEAENTMRAAGNELELYAAKEHDETKWEDEARRISESTRKSLINDKLSPYARDKIEMRLGTWETELLGRTKIISAKTSERKATESYVDRALAAAEDGNLDDAIAIWEEARKTGRVGADDARRGIIAARRGVEEKQQKKTFEAVYTQLGQNPHAALLALNDRDEAGGFKNFKELEPARRDALMGRARAMIGQQRDEVYGDTIYGVATGKITDPNDIKHLAESGRLDMAHAASLINVLSRDTTAPEDVARGVYAEATAYDPDDDTPDLSNIYSIRDKAINSGMSRHQLERVEDILRERKKLAGDGEGKGRTASKAFGLSKIHEAHMNGELTGPWQAERGIADEPAALALLDDRPWMVAAGLLEGQKEKGGRIKHNDISDILNASNPTEKVKLFREAWARRNRTEATKAVEESWTPANRKKIDTLLNASGAGSAENIAARDRSTSAMARLSDESEAWWAKEDSQHRVTREMALDWIGRNTTANRHGAAVPLLRATPAPPKVSKPDDTPVKKGKRTSDEEYRLPPLNVRDQLLDLPLPTGPGNITGESILPPLDQTPPFSE